MRRASVILAFLLTVSSGFGQSAGNVTVKVIGCMQSLNGSFQLFTHSGRIYDLKGDHDALFSYNGMLVRVTGTVRAADKSPTPSVPVALHVTNITELADTCE